MVSLQFFRFANVNLIRLGLTQVANTLSTAKTFTDRLKMKNDYNTAKHLPIGKK